jgi:NAD(P)-dependent dehydrogenase (short-subunit alcohol dehydrogenase family)
MNQSLAGKVAVVTGASRNMGRAFSEALAAEGASIVIHYRNPEMKTEAEDLAATVQKLGSEAFISPADLTDISEIEKLFEVTKLPRKSTIAFLPLTRKLLFSVCEKRRNTWLTMDGF